MDEKVIRDRLVSYGLEHNRTGSELTNFTSNSEANILINDLEGHPHAFVLACIMVRGIKAERAWIIPFKFQERMGQSFTMGVLSVLPKNKVKQLMNNPTSLHRYGDKMSEYFYLAIQRIKNQYSNDASRIWKNKPSSADVVFRFLEFEGVGPKIAAMAANILARRFKIGFSDNFSIDVSADVHVKRVFGRLGLCSKDATIEQIIYKARSLYPEFPGVIDYPCWDIGRNWCKPKVPLCDNCLMNDICPKVGVK